VRLPKFAYAEPEDIPAAIAMLQREPSAKILAGGTDLLVNMKHKVETPPLLVNIKRIAGLSYLNKDSGHLRLGALTTLKEIAAAPLVGEKLPALAQAAAAVGSYHHQVMGTLAGNICQQNRCKYFNQSQWWRSSRPNCFKAGGEMCYVLNKKEVCFSCYSGDLAPALLALGARVVLAGPEKAREIALADLFTGEGKHPLTRQPEEILTEIVIPEEALAGASGYVKFANRESIDFPIVGVAFWAAAQAKEYRVAFTAVDRKPIRGRQVEAFLRGKDLNAEILNQAAVLAAKEASPVKSSLYSPAYKRRLMGLLLHNAVDKALGRSGK